jgi:hypothetical protein
MVSGMGDVVVTIAAGVAVSVRILIRTGTVAVPTWT